MMVAALKALGVRVEERWAERRLLVHGCQGRFPTAGADLFLGNAGTAMRHAFLDPCSELGISRQLLITINHLCCVI